MQRARSLDAKARRTDDLLKAAEELALELGGVRHVTLAPVAGRAGLHRTAIRRYFANKEDLLLALAERGWREWRASIEEALEGRTGMDATALADVLTATLTPRTVFLDILTHATMHLEGEVPMERSRRFKTVSSAERDAIVGAVVRATPLTAQQASVLISAVASLAATYWQIANPTPTLAALYEQEPGWARTAYDLEAKVHLLAESIAIGLQQTLPAPDRRPAEGASLSQRKAVF